jgi:hypothetical protein
LWRDKGMLEKKASDVRSTFFSPLQKNKWINNKRKKNSFFDVE